jgi:tetratricopeptide (TPR) repeat protein
MLSTLSPIDAIRWGGRVRKAPAPARPPCIVLALVALLVTLMLVLSRPAAAQAVKGEATLTTSEGYGRLVIKFADFVDAQVRQAGGILIITFKQPVDVPVGRVATGAGDWIGAVRRDPDGRGLRFALARKLRVNSILAGERLFVDLLPETWTGAPPGLPQAVVEDLARRAREAERAAREQAQLARQQQAAPIRVRVAVQPTFTRYVFELPELTGVSTDRGKDNLTLSFGAPLRFDLADAKVASPPAVQSIDTTPGSETTSVRFGFSKPVDLRTFREDLNYVVDVVPIEASGDNKADDIAPKLAAMEPPETVPAKPATPEVAKTPAAGSAPPAAGAAPASAAPPAAVMPSSVAPSPAMPAVGQEPGPSVAEPAVVRPAPTMTADAVPPAAAALADPVPPAAPATTPTTLSPAPARPAAPAPVAEASKSDVTGVVTVSVRRQGDNLRLSFPFTAPTPSAAFQRADTLWLVFDSSAKLDLSLLDNEPSRTIASAIVTPAGTATRVVRLKLLRPRLTSLVADGNGWTVSVGDAVVEPSKPLTSVTIPFESPHKLHWLSDPEVGDRLLVVTGLGPARGLLKTHNLVDLRALASTHGVAIQPLADDVTAELSADKILLARPGGLTLSEIGAVSRRGDSVRRLTFDPQLWGFDRESNFVDRQFELVRAAADAPAHQRTRERLELARFYLSREMFAEAKAVLDTTIADERPTADDPTPLVLRAVASIMLGRSEFAMKDLANPVVGNQHDAQLWRGLAYARQGKWAEARESFGKVEAALGTLPLELQRIALKDSLRAFIEVGDFASAVDKLNDFQTLGVPHELQPAISVLTGRLHQGLGRSQEALTSYRLASESSDRPAAAQGRLRELALRYSLGQIPRTDTVGELESLTSGWRGDETEVEALQLLARLYTEESRYRDAFHVMRTTLTAHPNSDITRRIYDGAAVTFDSLFLAGKGDALPAIDALSLFYDFRELTPIGRRGDEMIRRLVDRLISVDLLDQAAELLQHQIDHRLQGAARAQVATRLAAIYLLNRKPDRAQAALRSTRSGDLSNEVRNQRLLLEARALSDLGRHDVALEVAASIEGRESMRLRSDILWAAQRWRDAAEQIELLYGDRWQDFQPLTETERSDILRAAVGFALAEDTIGKARLREKYQAKMAETPDQHSFALATGELGTNSADFRNIARSVAAVDTLEGFLREMRARYPDTNGNTPNAGASPAKRDADTTGSIKKKRKTALKR